VVAAVVLWFFAVPFDTVGGPVVGPVGPRCPVAVGVRANAAPRRRSRYGHRRCSRSRDQTSVARRRSMFARFPDAIATIVRGVNGSRRNGIQDNGKVSGATACAGGGGDDDNGATAAASSYADTKTLAGS